MENLQGLLPFLIALLFPLLWWLFSDRGGGDRTEQQTRTHEPYERYGSDASGYGQRGYGERTTTTQPVPRDTRQEPPSWEPEPTPKWEPEPEPAWARPPAERPISLEEQAPLERDYREADHLPATAVHADSIVEGGPRREEQASRPAEAPRARRARDSRRRLIAQLLTQRGLRQAMLVQGVLAKPKGLEADQDEAPLAR